MRLGYTKTKYSISYYVQKRVYIDGKGKDIILKRLGSEKQICERYGVTDAKAWAQKQVDEMRELDKEENGKVLLELSPVKEIEPGKQREFNGGYLFIQDIYYELGLEKICRAISKKSGFQFNLNSILSRLIYSRILYPSSKLNTFKESTKYIEQPDFELHQIYRALSVLSSESDYIQSSVFKNSQKIEKRKTGIVYYDCTNFYFEIEHAEDDKQYGISKENRPLPIIDMGLFMDAEGIPLSFNLTPGNENEQGSMIPLEKKMLKDFDIDKMIVCTDAGLSSNANRKFNDYDKADGQRSFVTTQSVKKLKSFLKDWAVSPDGWHLTGHEEEYRITDIDEDRYNNSIFFKDRWIKENGLEQHLIVTYSIKYRDYMRSIRSSQIERAMKVVRYNPARSDKKSQNDYKRFIKKTSITSDGEIANKYHYELNETIIAEEEKYDGIYAVCTNLDDDIETIIKINKWRWQIEECFQTMKSEFKSRPVYLHDKDRIKAHFITCFLALIVYRYLEKKLGNKYTCSQILECLREFNFLKFEGIGYIPAYKSNELTDSLHEAFGFRTSKEIIPIMKMRNICANTKK